MTRALLAVLAVVLASPVRAVLPNNSGGATVGPPGPAGTTIPPWTTYAPTWTGTGSTQPALGNGALLGRYQQIGNFIAVHIDLTLGSTTTVGNGTFIFGLPTKGAIGTRDVGSAMVVRSSVAAYSATAWIEDGGAWLYAGSTPVGSAGPLSSPTWQAGDLVGIDGFIFLGSAKPHIITALAISPTSTSVLAGGTQTFTASNGVAPFAWTLPTNGSGATAPTSSTASATYTAGPTGGTTDILQVTDSAGSTASAQITVGNSSPFSAVYVNNASTTGSGTVTITANVTAPTGSTDCLNWTVDDQTSNTWQNTSQGTRPSCSLGAPNCGSFSSALCSLSACSALYTAPACASGSCSFRVRATSCLDSTVGDWGDVTVTASVPFTSIYLNNVDVTTSSTSGTITTVIGAPSNATDSLDWTVDDQTSNTWKNLSQGPRPTCSLGGSNCGTISGATCTGNPVSCSATYTAPTCSSPPCTFRYRATSHLSPTTLGDWGIATVNSGSGSYTLSVSLTGTGAGSSSVSCNGTTCASSYASGTVLALTATAGTGDTFTGWSGDCSGTGGCTLTMSANRSVSASFSASGGGGGTLLAFPGCQGSGCKTRGGFASGSTVYFVTNLNTSGSGSLKACVNASGPRVCLFRVAGTITDHFTIGNGSLTVDARSAPPGGIQITDDTNSIAPIDVRASDVVLRGMKIRPNYDSSVSGDSSNRRAIKLYNDYGDLKNIVIDHNSIEYANATPVDMWVHDTSYAPFSESTLSWNIIAQNFYISGDANMSRSAITGCTPGSTDGSGYHPNACDHKSSAMVNVDFHHNLIAFDGYRNPEFKHASGRLVNNYLLGWGRHGFDIAGPGKSGTGFDIVGNICRASGYAFHFNGSDTCIELNYNGNSGDNDWAYADGGGGHPTGYCTSACYYMTGNTSDLNGSSDTGSTNWTSGIATGAGLSTTYKRTSALATSSTGSDIDYSQTASAARTAIVGALGAGASARLDCGGNLVAARDSVDTQLVGWDSTTSGSPTGAPSGGAVTLPSISAVSTVCAATTKDNSSSGPNGACVCADADGDGIPDYYEKAITGSSTTAVSPTASTILPPYTNLEAYLSGAAGVP